MGWLGMLPARSAAPCAFSPLHADHLICPMCFPLYLDLSTQFNGAKEPQLFSRLPLLEFEEHFASYLDFYARSG